MNWIGLDSIALSWSELNWIDCNLPKTKVETEVTWVSCPRSFLPPEKGDKKWHYSYPITLTGICPLPFPFSSGLGWIYFPNIPSQIPEFIPKSTKNGIWKRKSSLRWRSLMFCLWPCFLKFYVFNFTHLTSHIHSCCFCVAGVDMSTQISTQGHWISKISSQLLSI